MVRLLGMLLALSLLASPAYAARKAKGKANCQVQLVKEANVSSISISFEADTQEECERAKSAEVETSYTGDPASPQADQAPKKKK